MFAILAAALSWQLGSCDSLQLEATLSDNRRDLTGAVRWRADAACQQLATYPGMLTDADRLGEVEAPWFYPEGFDPADMQLNADTAATPARAEAAWSPAPGHRVGDASVHFHTRVPRRLGAFGRHRDTVALLAGWHPLPGDGIQLRPRQIHYRICVPQDLVGLVGHQPRTRTGPRCLSGVHYGRFVPVFLGSQLRVAVRPHGIVLAPSTPLRGMQADAALPALREVGSHRDALAWAALDTTLAKAFTGAQSLGLRPSPQLLVVGPLRAYLSEPFDGGLLVSDRALHPGLGPAGSILGQLQAGSIERSLWHSQLLPQVAARESQLPAEVVTEAVVSALWTDAQARAAAAAGAGPTDAGRLLDRIAIIPEIDNLVFAPQTPFVDSYYAAPRLPRPGVGPWPETYARGLSGRLLYAKVRDELGVAGAAAAAQAYLRGQGDWLGHQGEVDGVPLSQRLRPWLQAVVPAVDYGLQLQASGPAEIAVAITAQGPGAAPSVGLQERIALGVVDAEGRPHRAERRGPGRIQLQAPGPPRQLQLDPEQNLLELWHPPGYQAGFNNRSPHRWRLLLNDITGLLSVTNQQLSLSADLSLRRLYEVRRRLGMSLALVPGSLGGSVTGMLAFGRELNALRLVQGLSASLGGYRLLRERNVQSGGYLGTLSLSYLYDTRLSLVSSFRGRALNASLTYGGGDLGQRPFQFVQAGMAGLLLVPLDLHLALVLRLRADWSSGQTPPQYALRLGGRYRGSRGYESDAARGRRRVLASTELRHTLSGDGRTNLGGVFTLTRMEGALFADATYLPNSSCPQQMYYDVGYGLRFLTDVFQISPSVLAVDVAVPIPGCSATPRRLPLVVYIAFLQSFSSF